MTLPHYLDQHPENAISPDRRAMLRRAAARLPDNWGDVLLEMGGDLPVSEWAARSGISTSLIRGVVDLHLEYRRLDREK
jgi:hypothetical protein